MKKLLMGLLTLGLAFLLTTSAYALTAGIIPGGSATNEFVQYFDGAVIGGYYGANLALVGGDGTTTIQLDYYGAEAGYKNEFYFGGGTYQFKHTGGHDYSGDSSGPDIIATSSIANVANGLLDFSFLVPDTGKSVVNGANPANVGNTPNFFTSFDPDSASPGGPMCGQAVWLFLDDGGAGNDDNHDDMLVRLSIAGGGEFSSVPEPATMMLFGLGLLSLAGVSRRRKN